MTYGVFVKCQTKGQALKIAEWIQSGTSDEKPPVLIVESEEWILKTTEEYKPNKFNIKKSEAKE
jgi:hypothetical protein